MVISELRCVGRQTLLPLNMVSLGSVRLVLVYRHNSSVSMCVKVSARQVSIFPKISNNSIRANDFIKMKI